MALLTVALAGSWGVPAGAFNNYMQVGPDSQDHGRAVVMLSRAIDDRHDALVALGELAFKSSEVLGIGFSCDSCHPDGGASQSFFFEGLSDKPGNVDVTNRALTLIADGIFNPVNIPSIRGAAHTAPFRRDGLIESVRDFAQFAIINEFHGPDPSDIMLDSLAAFQNEIPFPDNPMLDQSGRLTSAAPEAAHRGAEIFERPFDGRPAQSCATCHPPSRWFVDGRQHDIGTGRVLDTPTLRDLADTAPYYHDGRFDSLAEVVADLESRFALDLGEAERADLLAYLNAVGGGEPFLPPVAGPFRIENAAILLEIALSGSDYYLADLTVEQIVRELEARRGEATGEPIGDWIQAVRKIEVHAAIGAYDQALDALRALPALARITE